jgi:hypothetical protein
MLKVIQFSLFTLFMFILYPSVLLAQFKLSAEIRPRTEFRDGYKKLNSSDRSPAILTSQRSRISIYYKNKQIEYNMAIQDVRIWGDDTHYSSTGMFGNNSSLEIYEAWFNLLLGKKIGLKIGRQNLIYDDERIFASRNWNQTGISYDAILLSFKDKCWKIDGCVSLNNQMDNLFGNEYPPLKLKTINFLHLNKRFRTNTEISMIGIASGLTPSEFSNIIYVRGTYGFYLIQDWKSINFALSGFYQNGKNKIGMDVSAHLFSIDANIKYRKLRMKEGIHILSGQNEINKNNSYQETDHLFDILYGARHRFYGYLDYFNDMPKSTGNAGLIDIFTGLVFSSIIKCDLEIAAHHFALDNKVINPLSDPNALKILKKSLGTEIDIVINHLICQPVNLKLGYSFILPTHSLEALNGLEPSKSDFSQWAWIMLTFSSIIYP